MAALDTVSLREAQFILGRPEADINRAIDRGDIDKLTEEVVESAPSGKKRRVRRALSRRGRQSTTSAYRLELPRAVTRRIRKIGRAELVYLSLEQQLRGDLTPAGRRKLYEAIKAGPSTPGKVMVGPLQIDTKQAVERVQSRYRELLDVRRGVVDNERGDPQLRGTDISVYVVASLAEGQTTAEILEDYPDLTAEQVAQAKAYAEAYPKKGRPYPARSFKRMLGGLAASGALDDGSEEEEPLTLDMLR